MPTYFFADLVRELCHQGGTGPLTPTGAVPGHRCFVDAVPAGPSFHYAVAGIAQADQWEVGVGRIDGDGRLLRDTVAASSNDGARVDFAPGLKTLALTVGADWFAACDMTSAALGEGLTAALDAKQPVSTGHDAAATGASGDLDTGLFRAGANAIGFAAAGTERMRLTASGVGVGVENPIAPLHLLGSSMTLAIASTAGRGGGNCYQAFFDSVGRKSYLGYGSSDDSFYLMNEIAAPIYLGTNSAIRLVIGASGNVHLMDDNSRSLGAAPNRWSVVYAGTGTINTSDAREKQWRGPATVAELTAARRIAAEVGFFQWRDAIDQKGAAGARYHFGVRAQAVWAIMADEGLVEPIGSDGSPGATPYAFLCWDAWEEAGGIGPVVRAAGDRFGVRTDQLLLFLIAAQEARLAALEAAA